MIVDLRFTTSEEADNTYARVISCSFSCFSFLLEAQLPLKEKVFSLLSEPKVWEFSQHESFLIRVSVYSFVKTLVKYAPGKIFFIVSTIHF